MVGIRCLQLVPHLLSDGGISPKGKAGWLIYFRNKNIVLINDFCIKLQELTTNTILKNEKKDGTIFVRLNDKKLGEEFLKISPSYRTKACKTFPKCPHYRGGRCASKGMCQGDYPPAKIPKEIFVSKKSMQEFLKVYLSCDGGVSVSLGKNPSPFLVRKVFVNAEHSELRYQLGLMFKHLGYVPKIYHAQIRLTQEQDIKRFAKEIRFIEGVKIGNDSHRFSTMEKNLLLDKIVNSYHNAHELITLMQAHM